MKRPSVFIHHAIVDAPRQNVWLVKSTTDWEVLKEPLPPESDWGAALEASCLRHGHTRKGSRFVGLRTAQVQTERGDSEARAIFQFVSVVEKTSEPAATGKWFSFADSVSAVCSDDGDVLKMAVLVEASELQTFGV